MSNRADEIEECLPNLRRFAMSLTANLADADDLLQNTVVRLLERDVPEDATLLPWAIRVCRNLWIDEVRSRKVRRDAARDPGFAGDTVIAGEEQLIGQRTLDEVRQALGGMSGEQRSVLLLVAVEGYSYKKTAAALEIPIGTVMSRLARARATLAERSGRNREDDNEH